jgi:hypothetical protein
MTGLGESFLLVLAEEALPPPARQCLAHLQLVGRSAERLRLFHIRHSQSSVCLE